jgi:thiol-disulfide isomerase/thioredoxin
MRLLCAAALSLVCGLWMAFADDKNPEQIRAERTARLAAIKAKFDATFKELEARYEKAPQAEKRGVVVEMREETQLAAGKALKVAEIDPKDEAGFAALEFIARSAGRVGAGGADVVKAMDLLAEHHAANPKVRDFLTYVMMTNKPGEKLLRAVSEKGADTDTRAIATVMRGYQAAQAIDDSDEDARIVAAVKAAADLLEAAKKLSPNAKVDDTTVAQFADDELKGLKALTSLLPGNPAPAVESRGLDDKKATLADYKGKVVVLDFWNTGCGPCKEMIPHQREVVRKYADRPFALISASSDPSKKVLEDFIAKQPMPWVHWWNPDYTAQKTFRIWATPTVFVIDHTGVIRFRAIGEINDKQLDKLIEDLVKEAEKAKG